MVLVVEEAQVEARFGLFGIVLILIVAQFAWNVPYVKKSIWTHPMELLDDVCHMESRLFGDNVSFGAR